MKKPWKILLYIVGGVVGIWMTAKFLLPIGLPFLFGFALARLAHRPVSWLFDRGRVPRWLGSFFVVSLISAALAGLLWLLGKLLFSELEQLAQRLPRLLPDLSDTLSQLHSRLLRLTAKLPPSIASAAAHWLDRLFEGSSLVMDTASGWIIGLVGTILGWIPEIFLFLLTMLLSAYLFSSQQPQLLQTFQKFVPESWRSRFSAILKRLKSALGGYFKAQGYLIAVTFGLLLLGLLLLGRSKAILTALIIAVLDALPVFGCGTVLIPWAILAFVRADTTLAIGLLLLYAVCAVARSFLEPRFLGRQMGLHPLLTLLALYAGFRLFGVLGMILVPIGVILVKQLYDLVEAA